MKMVCHREGFLSACQLGSAVAPSKDVKPVLRNLKAVAKDDRCTIIATDQEVGIRVDVLGVKVEEPGDALLQTGRLIAILRESTDDELQIEAGMDACLIQGASTEFEMPGEDPAAFPDFPEFAEDAYHELTAGVLREMIRRVIFSVSSAEHSKFGATVGVLWEFKDDNLTLVATDGRRLAMSTGVGQSKQGHSTDGQMPVVPLKAMSLLERNLVEPDELVKVCFRPNEVLMKTERAMLYSRLVEGRFPNYRQVVPKESSVKVSLTVGPFYSAIRQAAIMTDDESKRVIFQFAKNRLTLKSKGAESGRSKVELVIDYDHKPIEIGFDPKFIGDMLKVLEPDAGVILEMTDDKTPVVFRHGDHYVYVVVPLVSAAV